MNGKNEEDDDMAENSSRRPETALEEILHEVEDAEKRVTDDERDKRHRGEAGEAITPNARAEEESQGD
ncbi:hypothetical protein AB0E88_15040 [Streptomyces sp. NPDC028635]|uniref:hypothetical protein n=1 Tax=Streptomyces sp. NPDC028635 TaxID=3154800 RepID=UPI0033F1DC8A